jgi:hypothetical protein
MEAEKGVQLSSRKEGVTMTGKGCRWVYWDVRGGWQGSWRNEFRGREGSQWLGQRQVKMK